MLRISAVLLVVLAAGPAWAKREKPDPLREAQKLIAADKLVDAVKIYAAELALAQKKADIQWQQRVVRAISENIPPYMLKDRAVRVVVMHTLMDALNPKKAYAFMYAGGLAYSLLHEMTVRNERTGIEKIEAACLLQIKRKHAGAYERAMLNYAEGLKAVESGATADALRNLSEAFDAVRESDWAYSAMHIGTELAASLNAKGDDKRTALALARIAQLLGPRADAWMSADWIALVKSRLAGASEMALKPFNEFLETKPLKVQAAKGRTETTKASGTSKLTEVWKKVPRRQPFTTATRNGSDYTITMPFDDEQTATQAMQAGVTYLYDGGLTLAFWDNRVRLYVADLEGWRAIPPPGHRPHPLLCFTPLANGSVWGVNRNGELVVKHKAE